MFILSGGIFIISFTFIFFKDLLFILCVCVTAHMLVCVLMYVVHLCLVPGVHGGPIRASNPL